MSATESPAVLGRYSVPPGVLSEVVDGETVLLHLDSGTYFGLNRTGTRFWQLLLESGHAARISSVISAEFGVEEETVKRDLADLLRQLTERGLLVAGDPG
jgi:hypothetical protein